MMKRLYLAFGLAGLLAFLLASCGGQGGGDSRRINASMGTWNYGGQNVGFFSILWADLAQPTSVDGFTFAVTGPNGFSFSWPSVRRDFLGPMFRWSASSSLLPSSGTYTITASLGSGFSRQITVNATAILPQPQNITVQATRNSATITWSAVPGAKSYLVELWLLDQNGNPVARPFGWYTADTQVQFSQAAQITLPPGDYRARLWAFSVDVTRLTTSGQAPQLDPQVNLSSGWSSQVIQVQSVGTLKVLDLPVLTEPTMDGEGGLPE